MDTSLGSPLLGNATPVLGLSNLDGNPNKWDMTKDEGAQWTGRGENGSLFDSNEDMYIFDNVYIRVALFAIYSIVFFFCFFGNLAVVLVMTLHWRMRSITKFCLGNLAFANLCVGIFCIYQNLSMYLIDSWIFGTFMCKMYHFTNNVSHTASTLILVVVSVERYMVIIHPFKSRRFLTMQRLKLIILAVWIISALLCAPRLFFIVTLQNRLKLGGDEDEYEVLCVLLSNVYDSSTADIVQFILLFLLPLLIISALYAKMGVYLRSRGVVGEPTKRARLVSDSKSLAPSNSSSKTESGNSACSSPYVRRGSNNVFPETRLSYGEGSISDKMVDVEGHNKEDAELEEIPECGVDDGRAHFFNSRGTITQKYTICDLCKSRATTDFNGQRGHNRNLFTIISMAVNNTESKSRKSQKLSLKTVLNDPRRSNRGGRSFGQIQCTCKLNGNYSPEMILVNNSSFNSKGPRLMSGSIRACSIFRRRTRTSRSATSIQRSHTSAVRMLIIIVITFAICNLPFHLRKMYQHFVPIMDLSNGFHELLIPLSFLAMYANCAINPILYAFMSKSFRSSCMDVVKCKLKKQQSGVQKQSSQNRLAV